MASLDDVARSAQVSTATASRALSGRGRLAESTRARVRAVAADLGYVASAAATALASGRAENVGVVVPLMDRWFFATVLDGIAARLAPRGYDLTLYNVTDDPAQRRGLFETSLRRGRVDGLIVLSTPLSDAEVASLRSLGLPLVGLGMPRGDVPGLRVDDEAVGRAATEHLLALGHREIVHLGHTRPAGDAADPAFDIPTRRRRGFEAALADAGLRAARTVDADFTVDGGRRATHELLRSPHSPHSPRAIFAASDEMAYGAIAAARDLGLGVPGDLSIVGVDGHDLAGLFDLTTIDQFPREQGELVGEAVLAALDTQDGGDTGRGGRDGTVGGTAAADAHARALASAPPLPFELVVRGTTAPPA